MSRLTRDGFDCESNGRVVDNYVEGVSKKELFEPRY
jgi:hypothetical protein